MSIDITIRPLTQHDLPEAERIVHFASGMLLELPDPTAFMGDARAAAQGVTLAASVAISSRVRCDLARCTQATTCLQMKPGQYTSSFLRLSEIDPTTVSLVSYNDQACSVSIFVLFHNNRRVCGAPVALLLATQSGIEPWKQV
jgi:hypothetical protein